MPEHVENGDCVCWGCISDWEARSRARDSLTLLCCEHPSFDFAELGRPAPTELALLVQLKKAGSNSSGSERVGRSLPGVPFDVVASEMYSSFARSLHDAAVFAGAVSCRAGADPLRDGYWLLQKLDSLPAEWVDMQSRVWADWVVRIRAYLNPERRIPIEGACPAPGCGAEFLLTCDEDGSPVHSSAVVAVVDDGRVGAFWCQVCESTWSRAQVWEVARDMGLDISGLLDCAK